MSDPVSKTTKIEVVARALWRLDNPVEDGFSAAAPNDWDRWPETGRAASRAYVDHSKADYREQARIAIAAWEAESNTTKLAQADHHLLSCLSEQDGWTAGEIARQMGYIKIRRESQLLRRDLIRLETLGLVGKLDDEKPTAWVRTPAGTEAMNQ